MSSRAKGARGGERMNEAADTDASAPRLGDAVLQQARAGFGTLAAVEWKIGTNMRIVELVAPLGGEAEMRSLVGSR
jgi:hypothetical protein